MIDASFVKAIAELSAKANEKPTITVDGESHLYFWRIGNDGRYVPDSVRLHQDCETGTLDSFVAFVNANPKDGIVFISENGPKYYYTSHFSHPDQHKQADSAGWILKKSKAVTLLETWEANRTLVKQDQLVSLLRTTLRNAAVPGTLLASLKSVTWRSGAISTDTIDQKGRSAGRQLEAKLDRVDELPEDIAFEFDAWDSASHNFRMKIGCTLEVDARNEGFILTPYPGSISKAWGLALEDLADKIRRGLLQQPSESADNIGPIEVYIS